MGKLSVKFIPVFAVFPALYGAQAAKMIFIHVFENVARGRCWPRSGEIQQKTNIASVVSTFSPSHLTLLKQPYFVIQEKSNFVNQDVRFPIPLPYLGPKSVSFPTLFMT